jgi:multidrug efflux pump subunit AcrA (membrane-fusion protein)
MKTPTTSFNFSLNSCQKKQSEQAPKEATLVEIIPVRQGDIFKEVRFTGSIEGRTEVKVFPKITAKVEAMKSDLGDPVKKGDLIALLESEELKTQVAQAEAATGKQFPASGCISVSSPLTARRCPNLSEISSP